MAGINTSPMNGYTQRAATLAGAHESHCARKDSPAILASLPAKKRRIAPFKRFMKRKPAPAELKRVQNPFVPTLKTVTLSLNHTGPFAKQKIDVFNSVTVDGLFNRLEEKKHEPERTKPCLPTVNNWSTFGDAPSNLSVSGHQCKAFAKAKSIPPDWLDLKTSCLDNLFLVFISPFQFTLTFKSLIPVLSIYAFARSNCACVS